MTDAITSAAGMRIIRLLAGSPAQTVSDLIERTGVTRTAITEQLNELVATGFVSGATERLPGRGRPKHLYRATNTALVLLFDGNQQLVVPAMWRAIEKVGGSRLTQRVLKDICRSLADEYSPKITAKDPEKRLQQMAELLRQEGALVEIFEQDGQVVLRKRSSPFIGMLDDLHHVCRMDQEMMAAVVGQAVRRVACRHDRAPCCEFGLENPVK